jgi:N-succinyldiaminopimelate aminotransferase
MAKVNRAERGGPRPDASRRSPFVRLTELLARIEPGKPPINLSVGEPRHPIPGFVGPVLTEHVARFGRYPATG